MLYYCHLYYSNIRKAEYSKLNSVLVTVNVNLTYSTPALKYQIAQYYPTSIDLSLDQISLIHVTQECVVPSTR